MNSKSIEKNFGRLHWAHWAVVCLSLILTILAWHYTKSQGEEKVEAEFHRQAKNVIELVKERMAKYEDGLWGGVAAIQLNGGELSRNEWHSFANSLQIDKKYPGISGIGVIHSVTPEVLSRYIKEQQKQSPNFKVFPQHNESIHFPITYIEPEKANQKAIGLDIAHESNRLNAAKKARDTGLAQISGPIILVQDTGKTPGFLFYAPFYKRDRSKKNNASNFTGLVYAPFTVKKLMQGTLLKKNRQIAFSIQDDNQNIFDEHSSAFADFDPNPLFKSNVTVDLYGRTWNFEFWSAKSFREASKNNQPLVILIGGLFIDTLLLILFILLSNSNQRAIRYANSMTLELKKKTTDLERSNVELEQFAYVASHDLQAPVRHITAYANFLDDEFDGTYPSEDVKKYISTITKGAKKMSELIDDLLAFSAIDRQGLDKSTFTIQEVTADITNLFSHEIKENQSIINIDDQAGTIFADKKKLTHVFQNLISNALKYTRTDTPAVIKIFTIDEDTHWHIKISDNGIGIKEEFHGKIFKVFQRLHSEDKFKGTGIGLSICKKIVELHDGEIWVETHTPHGSIFHFTIKKTK